MRSGLHSAYVLHHRPYRDTSLLLEAFSAEHGRVGLVARGVNRPKSRWKGLLQPFVPLIASWTGRGELGTLTAAEEAAPPLPIPAGRLFSGLYVNELLVRLLPRDDPHPGLFTAYEDVVKALRDSAPEEAALRVFEKRLLAALGYGLLLQRDSRNGMPVRPDGIYHYVPEYGPVAVCDADVSAGVVRISGRSLLALQQETIDDAGTLREIKRLTRVAIAVCLEGRPLRTRELWLRKCKTNNRGRIGP